MKRLFLFAKTCHSYWLWLTTELPLYKLWLFALLVSAICIGTGHLLPIHWEKTPWHSIMIVLASSTGVILGMTFFVTTNRGLRELERCFPWFLPTVAICFVVGITSFVIKEKGIAYVWTGFFNEVLKPIGYIMAGAIGFAVIAFSLAALVRKLQHRRSKV